MSNIPNPFDGQQIDLGSSNTGIERTSVDQLFSVSNQGTEATCIVCSNTPVYRLVPKKPQLRTAEIEDKGFICGHCVQRGHISPEDYALRDL